MASRNDVTGDSLVSRSNSDTYRDNWSRIFGKKDEESKTEDTAKKEEDSKE